MREVGFAAYRIAGDVTPAAKEAASKSARELKRAKGLTWDTEETSPHPNGNPGDFVIRFYAVDSGTTGSAGSD